MTDDLKGKIGDLQDKLKKFTENAGDDIKDAANDLKEKIDDLQKKIKDAGDNAGEDLKSEVDKLKSRLNEMTGDKDMDINITTDEE